MIANGIVRSVVFLGTFAVGKTVAEQAPITESSPIAIGLVVGLLVTAFWVGMTLKGILLNQRYFGKRLTRIERRLGIEVRAMDNEKDEDD